MSKLTLLEKEAIDWATKLGINERTGVRLNTVVALYQRYKDEENIEFIKKMCSSKTRMTDEERTYHELVLRQYPDLYYEVSTPYGSIDFVDFENLELIEVKNIRSWKQASALLVYAQAFNWLCCLTPVVIYFGDIHSVSLRRQVMDTIPNLGMSVSVIDKDGKIENLYRFTEPVPDPYHKQVAPSELESFLKEQSRYREMFRM